MPEDPVFVWNNCTSFDCRFDETSQKYPHRTALIFGSEELTYADLAASVCAISNHIGSITTHKQKLRTAVYLPRSVETIQAILACQRAGVQYVPVDTTYPKERVAYMLQDARPDLVISRSDLLESLPKLDDAPPVLAIDDLKDLPNTPSDPNDTSHGYVIYTSGSTGRPKGVNLGGPALQNIVQWQCDLTNLPSHSRTGQFAPFSFDVSFQEIFATLCSGGTLVMFSQDQKIDPLALLEEIARTQVNRLFLPFVALSQLVQSAIATQTFPSSLREIHVAGEQLVISDTVRQFFAALPDCRLFNQYGPSETHVVSCHQLPRDPYAWARLPKIGKAVQNVELHVIGKDGKSVPPGAQGELFVTGAALADEYLNQSALTQERFPTIKINGRQVRAYKTGDQVTSNGDGCLCYLGRLDQQIKFNGFRVDPGEIESVLADHNHVNDAVVVFDPSAPPSGALYACVTARNPAQSANLVIELDAFLAGQLPAYMLPTELRVIDEIPKTPSGKVDRKSLLEQIKLASAHQSDTAENLASGILTHWRQILRKPTLSMRDNVFEHGAKSIMLPDIQRRLLSMCGTRIAVARIFQFPTSEGLAAFIEGKTTTDVSALNSTALTKAAFGLLRKKLAATPSPSKLAQSTQFAQKEI